MLWKGKGGAGINDIFYLLEDLGRSHPPPALLILHFGTNDLVRVDEYGLRMKVAAMLQDCASMLPLTTIFWSDILPRVVYQGARSQPALERKRRTINKWARAQSAKLTRVFSLHHPQFTWDDFSLFLADGVHLSRLGNGVFTANLRHCILSALRL